MTEHEHDTDTMDMHGEDTPGGDTPLLLQGESKAGAGEAAAAPGATETDAAQSAQEPAGQPTPPTDEAGGADGADVASSASAPDTSATDYGDFGFGEDAHIDRQSEDYRYYTDLFRQIGLSPEQAHQLLKGHRDYATSQLAAREQREAAELADYRARTRQELVSECGGEAAFKAFGQTALRGFRACATGAGLSQADADGIVSVMGDDPRFVKIFHHIGQLHQEDVLVSGAGGGREQSFDEMFRGMFGRKQ